MTAWGYWARGSCGSWTSWRAVGEDQLEGLVLGIPSHLPSDPKLSLVKRPVRPRPIGVGRPAATSRQLGALHKAVKEPAAGGRSAKGSFIVAPSTVPCPPSIPAVSN